MTPKELAELDLAVAKAEGFAFIGNDATVIRRKYSRHREKYQPTRDGAEAMRLLEKYHISVLHFMPEDFWLAQTDTLDGVRGPTPTIAICRAVAALTRQPAAAAGFVPTERGRFCNYGDGCKDSWHVGGNYGSPVCRNPAHHKAKEQTK